MKLTDRDVKVLLDIQDYGLLPTKLISARHFTGVDISTVLRRLRVLEENKYLKRIAGLDNGAHAWCMTAEAAEKLNGKPAKTSFPRQIIEHDLALVNLRMRLEETGVAQAWISEHVIRKRMAQSISVAQFNRANIPDGLMGVVTKRGNKFAYAIELEMTAKSQVRYRDIFRQYERRSDLQAYWYIVQKPTIGRQLMKAARQGSYLYGDSPPYLFWSALDEVLSDPLKAMVHSHRENLSLRDLLTPAKEVAHEPAQAVGT